MYVSQYLEKVLQSYLVHAWICFIECYLLNSSIQNVSQDMRVAFLYLNVNVKIHALYIVITF